MEFSGEWQLSWKPKMAHLTRIDGVVRVEGVADEAAMTGRLSVKFPNEFELAVEFTDSRGERCTITVKAAVPLLDASHKPAKGALSRGTMPIGEVELHVDWSLVIKALPSLWASTR